MGRKSKGSKPQSGPTINKIEKYEDTLQEGGVDDYIFKRDQINFEDAPSEDEDINGEQGEEVLGLNWKRAGDDADEDDAEEEYEEEADDWAEPKQRKAKAKADLSTKGRFGKEDVSSDEYSEEEGSGSESEEEGWGRQYYSRPSTRREKEKEGEYDAQREEERDMEEREVRRLQRRARETLAEDDWGLDDVEVEYAAPEKVEVAVAVAAPETDDPAVLIRHLQAHEPLKLALARDFPLVLRKLRRTAKGIKRMTKEREGEESLHKGLGWLHYQALLTYATTLAFYIHLCALPADERPDMSSHPILQRLLQLKEGVATLEDLDFAAGSVSDAGPELFEREGDEDMLEDEDEEEFAAMMAAKRELMGRMQAGDEDDEDAGVPYDEDEDMANLWNADGDGFDDSELADLIADAERGGKKSKKERKRGKKSKKPKADSDDEEATTAFTPMAEPEFVSTKKSKKSKSTLADADATLGDITELSDADAGDKDKRTRSLRFHTSKIAATSARRSAARDKRLGGDDDIPYRDKQAARDAALRKNAPKGNGGEDLDGSEWTDSDRKRAREVRDEADEVDDGGDDGYYDLVKRRKVQKDEDKAAKHEAFLEDKFASFEEFDETTDGPRALTRAIEKNRGLTPRRAKTGRNPRVKKRMAFEKAKQKVGSQRAVFKGGQSALSGSYSGEKTGISTVSKSRKF